MLPYRVVCLAALLLFCRAAGAVQHPSIVFAAAGTPLDRLPGAGLLNPSGEVPELNITLTAARLEGPAGAVQPLLTMTVPVYRDDISGSLNVFGPTMRFKGGQPAVVHLWNNLTEPEMSMASQATVALNGYGHMGSTNLHAHGMHQPTGVAQQSEAGEYKGNDNIFYTLHGKADEADAPQLLSYTIDIKRDHMPGLFWIHPHRHGTSAMQTPTASALVIVEDNPAFLPDSSGCKEVRELLASAPEVILHFALMPLMAPTRGTRVQGGMGGGGGGGGGRPGANAPFNQPENYRIDDPNTQIISEMADPSNPLCCGQDGTEPVAGEFANTDFVLVNGGWQPSIPMKSGAWYRWRAAWATTKRFASLAIVDGATGKPTDACELLLLTKDGHYLLQVPRAVDHIFLAPGNRAELLVQCSGAKGSTYVLRAQAPADSPFLCDLGGTPNAFVQDTLATISITEEGSPQPTPQLKACTPARAGYSADLQDAALKAAGATDRLVVQDVTFTMQGQPYSCLVNGQNFQFPDSNPIDLPLGSVVEWNVNHVAVHPLHTHTNPMQIQELLDSSLMGSCQYSSWFEAGDYQDVIMVPPMLMGATIRLRIQPGEFTGIVVMHCHSLQHEDVGCMKVMKYSCPGQKDPQPLDCPGFQFPVPGTVRFE